MTSQVESIRTTSRRGGKVAVVWETPIKEVTWDGRAKLEVDGVSILYERANSGDLATPGWKRPATHDAADWKRHGPFSFFPSDWKEHVPSIHRTEYQGQYMIGRLHR